MDANESQVPVSDIFQALQCVARLISEVESAKQFAQSQISHLNSLLATKDHELQESKAELQWALYSLELTREKLQKLAS
jgi:ABC-type transporter Mla subunit MlaD